MSRLRVFSTALLGYGISIGIATLFVALGVTNNLCLVAAGVLGAGVTALVLGKK